MRHQDLLPIRSRSLLQNHHRPHSIERHGLNQQRDFASANEHRLDLNQGYEECNHVYHAL